MIMLTDHVLLAISWGSGGKHNLPGNWNDYSQSNDFYQEQRYLIFFCISRTFENVSHIHLWLSC